MKKFFDETSGLFLLDEMIADNDSFKKIMADEIVSDEELFEQSSKVIELFRMLENELSEPALELVRQTVTELAVLYAINQYKELQDIR